VATAAEGVAGRWNGMDINEADSRHYECQLKRRQNAAKNGWLRGNPVAVAMATKTETRISNSGISDNSISHDVPKCLFSI